MVCPYCGGNLAVNNSRPQKSRNQTWRRRPCKACGAVFTSIEYLELSQAVIVSKPSDSPAAGAQPAQRIVTDLQPFSRDKLFISLYESLRHRPTASSDARGLCDTVTAHIISHASTGHVAADTIRIAALNTLQKFDAAAASHYAAFHKAT